MVEFVQCGVMDLLLTGVDVTNVDESTYEIFAPNKDAMEQLMAVQGDQALQLCTEL